MKKIFWVLICLVILLSGTLCGCNSYNAEKDYKISIYLEMREQDENGSIRITDYKLWKTLICPKTRMIEIPNYNDSVTSNKEFYYKSGLSHTTYETADKTYYCPKEDGTVIIQQRQKKNIKIIYNGKEISEYLTESEKKYYDDNYKNTYVENFYFGNFKSLINKGSSMYLYTDANKTKPYKMINNGTYYYSGFNCLTSRTLYLEII